MNTTILNATMAILFAAIGYSVCALLSVAKKSDIVLTNAPTEKPKRIFTVGCTVKWNGELFEIKKMTVGEDNQTDAVIKNDRAMLCVPIDDLEAVEE